MEQVTGEEDICGCDSALALKRNGEEKEGRRGEERRERQRLGETRVVNREGKLTATTVQYIVSNLNFDDRFFGIRYLLRKICNFKQ